MCWQAQRGSQCGEIAYTKSAPSVCGADRLGTREAFSLRAPHQCTPTLSRRWIDTWTRGGWCICCNPMPGSPQNAASGTANSEFRQPRDVLGSQNRLLLGRHQQPESSKVLIRCIMVCRGAMVAWLLACFSAIAFARVLFTLSYHRADTHSQKSMGIFVIKSGARRTTGDDRREPPRKKKKCYTVIGICQCIGTPREGHHFLSSPEQDNCALVHRSLSL